MKKVSNYHLKSKTNKYSFQNLINQLKKIIGRAFYMKGKSQKIISRMSNIKRPCKYWNFSPSNSTSQLMITIIHCPDSNSFITFCDLTKSGKKLIPTWRHLASSFSFGQPHKLQTNKSRIWLWKLGSLGIHNRPENPHKKGLGV